MTNGEHILEVWGDLACFTRPEMKGYRVVTRRHEIRHIGKQIKTSLSSGPPTSSRDTHTHFRLHEQWMRL